MGATTPEMSDEIEEFDIYDNLPETHTIEEEAEKLEEQVRLLGERCESLENNIEKLNAKLSEIKQARDNLAKNISELYKTAKAEIERKDRIISELRSQLDYRFGKVAPSAAKRPRENSISLGDNDTLAKRVKGEFDSHRSKYSPTTDRRRSPSKFNERQKHSFSRSRDDHKKEYKSHSDKHSRSDKKYEHRESSHKTKTTGDGKSSKIKNLDEKQTFNLSTVKESKKYFSSVSKDAEKPKSSVKDDKTKTEEESKTKHTKEDKQKTPSNVKDTKNRKEVPAKKEPTPPPPPPETEKKLINESNTPKDQRSENVNTDVLDGAEILKIETQTFGENIDFVKIKSLLDSLSKPPVAVTQKKVVNEPPSTSRSTFEAEKLNNDKNDESMLKKQLKAEKPPEPEKVKRAKSKTSRIQDVTTKLQKRLGVFHTEFEHNMFNASIIAHVTNAVYELADNAMDNEKTILPDDGINNVQKGNEIGTQSKEEKLKITVVPEEQKTTKREEELPKIDNGKKEKEIITKAKEEKSTTSTVQEVISLTMKCKEEKPKTTDVQEEKINEDKPKFSVVQEGKKVATKSKGEKSKMTDAQEKKKITTKNQEEKPKSKKIQKDNEVITKRKAEKPKIIIIQEEKKKEDKPKLSDVQEEKKTEDKPKLPDIQEEKKTENQQKLPDVQGKKMKDRQKLLDVQEEKKTEDKPKLADVQEKKKVTSKNKEETPKINDVQENNVIATKSTEEKPVTDCPDTANKENLKTYFEKEVRVQVENIFSPSINVKKPKLKEGSAKKESKENTTPCPKKEKPEEEVSEFSDRVLRSAVRRNSSREKLEKSTESSAENLENQTSKDEEIQPKALSFTPLKNNISTVNLTDEGEIPVLHFNDERSPRENYFDVNLSASAITSSPLRETVDLQILKEDLNLTMDQSSINSSKVEDNSSHSPAVLCNNSLQNSDLNQRTVLNTSSARKRRRVVVKMID